MSVLTFDTETSGLYDFTKPADDPSQPRVIELAAMLHTGPGATVSTVDLLVKPDGWIVPDDVVALHGITIEMCEAEGRPIREVLDAFTALMDEADLITAYGVDFDLKAYRGEARRAGLSDRYGEKPQFCILRACTPLAKCPPTPKMIASARARNRRPSWKPPKLTEAARNILGLPHDRAHRALVDVEMSVKLFWHLYGLDLVKPVQRTSTRSEGQDAGMPPRAAVRAPEARPPGPPTFSSADDIDSPL